MKSFLRFFRLIFVIFSLYLMGDAFFRWDGFRYYAPFSEFLPAVALTSILWTMAAVAATILIWTPFRILEWFCKQIGLKVEIEHVLSYAGILIILGTLVWKGKKLIWHYVQTSVQLKVVIFICVALMSIFLTWLLRNRVGSWMRVVHERITPLVWLFGIWIIFSIPLVAYHTWFKGTDKIISQEVSRPSVSENKPNIILVTFDALTARDMSVYGYHRETTPFISEWAKSASVFTRTEAESTITTSTTASLMTGKRLWTHLTFHQKSTIQWRRADNIALELKKNGYHTMAYIENSNASPEILGITDGFDDITLMLEGRDFLYKFNVMLYSLFHGKIRLYDWVLQEDFYPFVLLNHAYYTAYMPIHNKFFPEQKKAFRQVIMLLDKFISDIDKNTPPEPFFAWIHLYPPHAPYLPPEPFLGVFDPSPRFRTYFEEKEATTRIREHEKEGWTPEDLHDLKILRARYDEHILYCDKEFEDFIGNLAAKNILESAVIILSSDHGESFEHNHWAHGDSPYEPVIHIPLIIKEPNQKEGRIIDDVVGQIDIPSTIIDLAGVSAPSWLEGCSLLPLMRGEKLPSKYAFSMLFEGNLSRGHKITKGFINVYEDDYKLIYYLEEDKSLLLNLKKDPDELDNLFDREPEVGQRLLGVIKENLEKANERIRRG